MTVSAFLRSQPAWSSTDHSVDNTHPVTRPPPQACEHQRNPRASQVAKCGLKKDGQKCCDQAIPPTCWLMPNEKDKGGKIGGHVAIENSTHTLVSRFQVVRDYFHSNRKDGVDKKSIQGECPMFLSSKGHHPRATSDFRLILLNKAVFGDGKVRVTPQDLRAWNSTFLEYQPVARVSEQRGEATGNSQTVFHEHYNIVRQSRVLEALLTSMRHHREVDGHVEWNEKETDRRKKDKTAIEEANLKILFKEDVTDLTSKTKPVHPHLRKQFRKELSHLHPGLWNMAKGSTKESGLSEMKWVNDVVMVLGNSEAGHLRDVVYQQYRGHEDIERRRWSSLRSHLESTMQERMEGREPRRNCPLVTTLKQLFKSAKSSNKNDSDSETSDDE